MTYRRRSSCFGTLTLLLVAILVIGLAAFLALFVWAPLRAAETYGPSSPRLSKIHQVEYSVLLLWQAGDLTRPSDSAGAPIPFHIDQGESVTSVIGRLYADGLISNPGAFRTYLLYSGQDTSLQAGSYKLSPAMNSLDIAHSLQQTMPTEARLGVLSGWRMEEIASAIPTSGLQMSPEDYLTAARRRPAGYSFTPDLPSDATGEGFLFPDTYTLPRDTAPDQLVALMLDNFDRQVTPEIRQGFDHQGLSLYQAVILASIVQREAVVQDEMPLIASVFLNRLKINMKLDSDPTVQYALGYNQKQNTWWTNPLSSADLAVESPYNTYQAPSLPPGPISNPGLFALRAVAYPAQTHYYYFRASCDGSGKHSFSETYEEHVGNACP